MKPTIILVAGKKQSGKNTVADYISTKYDYTQMSFAEELKYISSEILSSLGVSDFKGVSSFEYEDVKRKVIPYIHNKKQRTYRELLQHVGSDWFKNFFNDSLWAEILVGQIYQIVNRDVVISDWRFPDEYQTVYEAFKDTRDIITIKIQRDSCDTTDTHISEKALDDFKFDYVLTNNGTKEELYDKIDLLLDCMNTQKAEEIGG